MRFFIFFVFVFIFAHIIALAQTPGTSQFPGSLDTQDTLIQTANSASTSLTAAMLSTDTVATVASTGTFPATGTITIDSEIVFYTGKTATTFTGLMRGQDGTIAAGHSSGVSVQLRIISRTHMVHSDAIISIQTKLGFSASTPALDMFLIGTGTGSSAWQKPSNIASASALSLSAGGINQNITLTPSGAGNTILNGLIGIGTTAPSQKLEVKGDAGIIALNHDTTSSYNQLFFLEGGTTKGSLSYLGTTFAGGRQNTLEMRGETGVDLIFSNAGTEAMRIKTGLVGIGTTAPGAKLDVVGSIQSSSQFISAVATGTAPFSIVSTTPVANLTAVPVTYNASGVQQTGVHIVIGNVALVAGTATVTLSGSAVFTSATSFSCIAVDQTATAAVGVIQNSGTSITFNGTATDTIRYVCTGN